MEVAFNFLGDLSLVFIDKVLYQLQTVQCFVDGER